MERKINYIKLYTKENDYCKQIAINLKKLLIDNNFQIVDANYDLAISIGGDGTFLKMIHENEFNDSIYYIGINAGTLGFLPEINANELSSFVNRLVNNDYLINELSFIRGTIKSLDGVYLYNSLNELTIRKLDLSVLKTKVFIDNYEFENYVGDGLVLSTATGSTAYNASLGGAIVDQRLKTISILPLAPIYNKVFKSLINPLVLMEKTKVNLVFDKSEDIMIINDGKKDEILNVQEIEFNVLKNIKCIGMNNNYFIYAISNKILK